MVLWWVSGFAQNVLDDKVVITKSSGSAPELLAHLELRANVVFSYSNKVCLAPKVVFSRKEASLKYYLDQIFTTCRVEYNVNGNKILITPVVLKSDRATIKGTVRDSITGEVLIGASVFEMSGSQGAASNEFGWFSFSLPKGHSHIGCSYVGYQTKYLISAFNADTTVVFELVPQSNLSEVSVVGMTGISGVYSTRTGTVDIPIKQIQNVPSFLGEVDLVKSIQLLPGVQSGNEGFSGLYVRGGGIDQNLILIDDVPVYNIDHLLGFFSIFNPDAINKVTLIKGGFPAQYGGRLSSVVDIRTFDGNSNKHNGSVSLGLLSSKVSFNGPLLKDKTTYSFSFRRTYFDILSAPFVLYRNDRTLYHFFDLNGKVAHRFSDKSFLTFSTYWGSDNLQSKYNYSEMAPSLISDPYNSGNQTYNDELSTGWGNIIPSLRWSYSITNRLFANLSVAYSNYQFYTEQSESFTDNNDFVELKRRYYSGMRDLVGKIDFDYTPLNNHRVKFGANYTFHRFYPGIDMAETQLSSNQVNDTTIGGQVILGRELHTYFQDEMNLSPTLKVNFGCHVSGYFADNQSYWSIEPRMNFRLLLSPSISLKGSFASMAQYMHVLSATNMSLPSDLWLPVTDKVEPLRSWQVDFGPEWEVSKGISFTVEGYYKKVKNILDYRDNQSFFDFSQSWDDKLTSGTGESYGIEMLLHRKVGDLSGWIGYTLSKSMSQFDDINNGEPFRANNDRRHDASVFVSYKISPSIDANLVWAFGSGKPVTLANEKFYAPPMPTGMSDFNPVVESYSKKNGYTMPSFHRLDIGASFNKENRIGKRVWSVGVMNVYGRQNPFFLYFSETLVDGNAQLRLKQFSLFPVPLPYIRYTLYF